jgi:hypothetical protein
MIMWTGPTFQTYYQNIHRIVGEKLDKEDSSYLLQVDFDEYLNFLVDEAKWEPLLTVMGRISDDSGTFLYQTPT